MDGLQSQRRPTDSSAGVGRSEEPRGTVGEATCSLPTCRASCWSSWEGGGERDGGGGCVLLCRHGNDHLLDTQCWEKANDTIIVDTTALERLPGEVPSLV